MIKLSCPACSAPFEAPDDDSPTVTCSYCGNSFARPGVTRNPRSDTAAGLAVGAIALVIGIIGAGVIAWYALRNVRTNAPPMPDAPSITAPSPNEHPETQLATRTLTIGEKGEGPARFDDNRTVAVDPAGRIYTAEYDAGRLQVFDADGKFLTQWPIGDERVVLDLVADRAGHLYLLNPQQITVYDTATGSVARTLVDVHASDLCLTLDNRVLALDESGSVFQVSDGDHPEPIVTGLAARTGVKNVRFERFAIDARGDLLLTDRMTPRVFRFSSTGQYLDRFEATGLSNLNGIAVDGLGRIFVSSVSGIGVYSAEGQRLGSVDIRQAFGIVFSDTGDLFVAARPTVVKFRMANTK
ncbi:MAG TPA: hypothetical protein PLF26_09375 [Blastocatellia bacterium]|nr:hypothetical protein [Blastocatellia bacterium]